MTRRDEFDNLLDQALSEYRDAQPIAGLEERLLRRLWMYHVPQPKSWRAAGAGAIAACVAVLLLAVALFVRNYKPQSPGEPAFSGNRDVPGQSHKPMEPLGSLARTRPEAASKAVGVPAIPRPGLHENESAAAIKQPGQAFPIPLRMTREEQGLVMLANAHPDALPAPAGENQLITIAPVVIEPLAFSAGEQGDN